MIRVVDLAKFCAKKRSGLQERGLVVGDDAGVLHSIRVEVPNVKFPNFPPQSQFNPIMQGLTELRPALTQLLLRISSMTSLTYDNGTAQYFSGLVTDTFEAIRKLMSNPYIMSAPSHWHHLTSAITGTLLVYAALLLRHQSTPNLSRINTTHIADCFTECAANLLQLAQGLPYARRVLADCQPVIDIGTAVVERWRSLSEAQRVDVGRNAVSEMIPPDVADLFPYKLLSPPLLAMRGTGDDLFAGAARSGSGVLWLF
jgi:hypothetical protein